MKRDFTSTDKFSVENRISPALIRAVGSGVGLSSNIPRFSMGFPSLWLLFCRLLTSDFLPFFALHWSLPPPSIWCTQISLRIATDRPSTGHSSARHSRGSKEGPTRRSMKDIYHSCVLLLYLIDFLLLLRPYFSLLSVCLSYSCLKVYPPPPKSWLFSAAWATRRGFVRFT